MLRRTHRGRIRKSVLMLILVAVALLGATPTLAKDRGANPGILPPQSKPHGHTYGEWAALWWQWALEQPASVNPLVDTTGEHCAQGQSGSVWFLAGSTSTDTIARTCTVPTGKALFFPIINSAFFAFLSDPPAERTEEFVRAKAKEFACEPITNLEVSIDGVSVKKPSQYFELSALFDVQLPDDNIFGVTADDVPQLLLSPVADQGYYLFVAPLSPGEHIIQWKGSSQCFSQDVTYRLNVQPGARV